MDDNGTERSINIFRPQSGLLRGEVRVIVMVLAAWLVMVVGSQIGIWYLENSQSDYWLSEIVFFNLPIHFWVSGQFLPLWFVLLGIVFNLWMDRHESRKFEGTIRYRATGRSKKEQQP